MKAFSKHALSNLPAGIYSFTAVATDNSGLETTSSAVQVNVADQPRFILTVNNSGNLQLNVTGTSGIPLVLESTIDFTSWTAITTNTPVAGATSFSDPVNQPKEFYRLVAQ